MDSKIKSIIILSGIFIIVTSIRQLGKEIFWYPLEKILTENVKKLPVSATSLIWGEINQIEDKYYSCFSLNIRMAGFFTLYQIFLENKESKYWKAK